MPRGTEARAAAGLAGLAGLCVFALVALPNPQARLLLGAASFAPAQLGFIGGAGVEGGQGNSDSIYGSHDDHATFGVAGSGWQGPGNGEAPGDLWNPAVGPRPHPYAGMKQQRRTAGAQGGWCHGLAAGVACGRTQLSVWQELRISASTWAICQCPSGMTATCLLYTSDAADE